LPYTPLFRSLHLTEFREGLRYRLYLGVFTGQRAKALLIADHFGITQQGRELLVAILQLGQFLNNRIFHDDGVSSRPESSGPFPALLSPAGPGCSPLSSS